jgi:hypothetical protein
MISEPSFQEDRPKSQSQVCFFTPVAQSAPKQQHAPSIFSDDMQVFL